MDDRRQGMHNAEERRRSPYDGDAAKVEARNGTKRIARAKERRRIQRKTGSNLQLYSHGAGVGGGTKDPVVLF